MNRSIVEATYWWPLAMLAVLVLLRDTHSTAIFMLGAVMTRRFSPVVYTWDPETLRFTYADPEVESFSGYTPDELYGLTVPDITTRTEAQQREVADVLLRGVVGCAEYTAMMQRKGENAWHFIRARLSLMIDTDTRPQILAQARALSETEIVAPSCALSVC